MIRTLQSKPTIQHGMPVLWSFPDVSLPIRFQEGKRECPACKGHFCRRHWSFLHASCRSCTKIRPRVLGGEVTAGLVAVMFLFRNGRTRCNTCDQ
jgi:hypothetical protein